MMKFNEPQLTGLQQAFLTIQKLKAKLQAKEQAAREPIAIIGVGCRFPGQVNSPQAFWELLSHGIDAITEIPANRWNVDDYFDADPQTKGKMYVRHGGFLEHIEQFDAQFFGISPREANYLDPQQRLLLEVSWEALENAGCNPATLTGKRAGVFMGMSSADFAVSQAAGDTADIDIYSGSGVVQAFGPGRISHVLGLQGPSLMVDTACSSSLTAIHLACQSLRNGESQIALAGGVQVILLPETYIFLCRAGALAPDGRCKTFAANADGYTRSEGCGVVVLKRYTDALTDGDSILAVIHGTAVNHDGASTGLTVPNGRSQEQVIRDALADANVEPAQVSYIEAHGTGTALGDPIEVEALMSVYGQARSEPLKVGSVKTNIGHTEAASGMAGLIKVILALQHKQLPKNLHFNKPNPYIPWEDISLAVLTEHTDWNPGNTRIAGISAFGMSGTNAHLIVAEGPVTSSSANNQIKEPLHCFTLSAKTSSALQQLVRQYISYLQTQSQLDISDICYTVNTGRAHFEHRLAICTENTQALINQLQSFLEDNDISGVFRGNNDQFSQTKIVFVCKEFSSAFLNCSSILYDTQPVFHQAIQQCEIMAQFYFPYSLSEVLFSGEKNLPVQTGVSEIANFALQYAFVELWRSWGIHPKLLITQGTGKYIGQYIAGVLSLDESLQELIQKVRGLPKSGLVTSKLPQIELTNSLSVLNNLDNSFIIEIDALVNHKEWPQLLAHLARLYVKGMDINWQGFNQDYKRKKIVLPTYCFERKNYWPEALSRKKNKNTHLASEIHPVVTVADNKEVHLKTNVSDQELPKFTMVYLRQVFSEALKIPVTELDSHKTYEVFGMDSLVGKEITSRLDRDLGGVSSTLLFEKNCLQDLSTYLQQHYHADLLALLLKPADLAKQNVSHQHKAQVDKPEPSTIKVASQTSLLDEPIAIIGLSGKYPLADDLDSFWENLKKGRDCITQLPSNRWRPEDFSVMDEKGHSRSYSLGGFLEDVDKFDPIFFNVSPAEASVMMDPQERLFLQTAWATFEDAGYNRERLEQSAQNKVGVFVGVTYHFYPLYIAEEWAKNNRLPLTIQFYSMANRLSYFMNFSGPSMPVDTACSSSLAAIHLACESIRRNECVMALVGGVNLSLHPAKYYTLSYAGFMSEQGRCASFAEGGNGYIPGEGVGAVLLKPLSLAIRDEDQIYGTILASTINHGGKTSGYTVPNPNAQAEVIAATIAKAKIDPRTISYIEAHGTGTTLGDPIEVKGLQNAFARYTQDKQFCAIGSVKSNIGHLEAAAGISQLTKVLLQLKHQTLAPSIHANVLNPYIHFTETPFYVQRELAEWRTPENMPRRAGISSFGAGGVNAHIIVEEYLPGNISSNDSFTGPYIFVLSAKSVDVLQEYVKDFMGCLQKELFSSAAMDKQQWLANICYTMQTGREAMPVRLALLVENIEELLEKLQQYDQQSEDVSTVFRNNQNAISHDETVKFTSTDPLLIIKHWLAGNDIAWESLYPVKKPRRITLPTYPFTKRRCWIPGQTYFSDEQTTSAAQNSDQQWDNDEWFYQHTWEKQKLENLMPDLKEGYWLIFYEAKMRKSLIKSFSQQNAIYCQLGQKYSQKDEHNFVINSHHLKDYKQLFIFLQEQGKLPEKVIYFETSSQTKKAHDPIDDLWQTSFNANPGQKHLIFLQALITYSWLRKPQLWIISQGAQMVEPIDKIDIWQHPLQAFISIFSMEQPEFSPKLIDLDPRRSFKSQVLPLYQILQSELPDTYIALRKDNYYALHLTKQVLEKNTHLTWKAPKAAIVTGGLGALGYEVSTWLAKQNVRYLLLTGNIVLPPREEWETIVDIRLRARINNIQNLESKGIHVYYAGVDVSNKLQMTEIIQKAETLWSVKIDGVFHLAGITTDSIMIEQTAEDLLKAVQRPKMQGSLVLHELFKDQALNCFVLFSSASAIPYFGTNGLIAYAAANAFMDGLACYRRRLGLTALSVNWTAWAGKGMSHEYKHDAILEILGITTLTVTQGLSLLEMLLANDVNHSIVMKVDWQKFLQINIHWKSLPYFNKWVSNETLNIMSKKSHYSYSQIINLLIECLSKLLIMQPEELNSETPLQSYGLDSISGLNFVTQLNGLLPGTVSPTDLYRYVTIQQLADYIYNQQKSPEISVIDACITTHKNNDKLMVEIAQLDKMEIESILEAEIAEIEKFIKIGE